MAIVVGELRALLTSETLPVTLPVLAGAKTTLKAVFCPGARVRGRLSPPTLRPLPETLTCETVTLALPKLDSGNPDTFPVPTPTFPKLALGGVTESCDWSGWTPMPLRFFFNDAVGTEIYTLSLHDALPVFAGAKTTLKVVFCPGVRVRGRLSPPTLRPLPETWIWETVTLALPELVRVKA